MPNSPLTIIAITTAKPGREAALGAAQEKLVTETLLEDGCLRYELHQSLDDGRIRIFVESWESDAQWRAHMEGAAMQRFQASGVAEYFADFALHRLVKVAG
ncbi:antibiotic biosynthesis monooxygenase [Mesorhizobium sp. B2-5-13]|uniref:putative quinol monooxygenase n=1 Tax=unclassified Mesorhizobium TaxID=325217 RepID=UPI00112603C3|nr:MULTISPECIES: putative quinol monooxygenase [unclassified Mesorhizobium]TPJ78787.1 antibiotic biosynthesis monooxygenase [Mesorhizobium sp. B2-5-13]TPK45005.1 antibiotic biosynthesis monooxygenase [Mesorhizobium sp. B2-5-5]